METFIWIAVVLVGVVVGYLAYKFWACPCKDTSCCQEEEKSTKKPVKKIKK